MVLAVDQLRIIETDRTSRRFRPRPQPDATAQIAALARRAILLPGLAPLIVLLQQPVETILDPAPQALKTGAPPRTTLTVATAGASTRDAIHKLAPGRQQTVEALIQRIGAPGCQRCPRAPIGPVAERFHHRRVPPGLHATESDPGRGGSRSLVPAATAVRAATVVRRIQALAQHGTAVRAQRGIRPDLRISAPRRPRDRVRRPAHSWDASDRHGTAHSRDDRRARAPAAGRAPPPHSRGNGPASGDRAAVAAAGSGGAG